MAIEGYNHIVRESFIRYVQIDTQSDPESQAQPSTEKQKDLSRLLVKELLDMGWADAYMDEYGYVFASIPGKSDKKNLPTICFCAHVDTAPDCSGFNVKPIVHERWDGSDILLPDEPIRVSSSDHPYLLKRIGDDIITASGATLLGADDKAGVAIIMNLANYFKENPDVKRTPIRILFTPDEEIGRGVVKLDMNKLGADFGYTLDGGERGHLEGETFSADAMKIIFHGVSAHPGYAEGKLVHSMKAAAAFLDALPAQGWSPETTSGRTGFVHPVSIQGGLETTIVDFIIRDFDSEKLKLYEQQLVELAESTRERYPQIRVEWTVTEQYRNMKEILDQHPQVMDFAAKAYKRAGLQPESQPIRGGTDGSRLSFMGMPCPNIFTGEMGIHSKQEYVSVQDMEKATEVLVYLASIWEEESPA